MFIHKKENGEFDAPTPKLPTNYKNVSNFSSAPSSVQIQHGWYSVNETQAPNYDESSQNIILEYVVNQAGDAVDMVWTVEEKTAEEQAAYQSVQAELLDIEKDNAKDIIDSTAERARLRHITTGSGQAMVYQEKGDQALDFVAAGYPSTLTDYPLIDAEVNATGKSPQQAADDILTKRSQWIHVGAQIEEYRLSGKQQVESASTMSEVEDVLDNVVGNLDSL